MGMRSGEDMQAAERRDVVQGGLAEDGAALEPHVSRLGLDEVGARSDAADRVVPEPPHAGLQLRPVAREPRLRVLLGPEAPSVLRYDVAGVEADRARGRRGEVALPKAAIVADESGQLQGGGEGEVARAHEPSLTPPGP